MDAPDVAVLSDAPETPPVLNRPPVWTDAPTGAVALHEGRQTPIPLTVSDPDGDTVTVTVTSTLGDLLDATVTPGVLTLRATFGTASKQTARVTLDDGRGGTQLVTIELAIDAVAWKPSPAWTPPDGPAGREHGAVLRDGPGKRLLLFGGSGYSPQFKPLADAWSFAPATGTWSTLVPTGDVPTAGASRRVAQDPEATEAWLFGGYTTPTDAINALLHVTWTATTLTFATVPQTNPPPPRSLHAFAYDGVTQRFVAFGGIGSGPLADLWTMRLSPAGTAEWQKVSTTTGPTARYGFFAGHDVAGGRLIVFSGAQGTAVLQPAQDTWSLDLRSDPPAWTRLNDGTGAPPGRRNGCAVYDPTTDGLFVFGGTSDAATSQPGLFVLDTRPSHATWAELATGTGPEPRSSGFGIYDPVTQRGYLGFGNSSNVHVDWVPFGY